MSLIDRFLTAFRGEDRGAAEPPGLFLDADAVTWVIGPDGTRTRVGGGGGSSAPWASFTSLAHAETVAGSLDVLAWEPNSFGAGTLSSVTLEDIGDGGNTKIVIPDVGLYLVTMTMGGGNITYNNLVDPARIEFEIIVFNTESDGYLVLPIWRPEDPYTFGAVAALFNVYEADTSDQRGFEVSMRPRAVDVTALDNMLQVKIAQLATT